MPNSCTLITALLLRLWFFRYHMSQHFTLVQSLFMHVQVCVCGRGRGDGCVRVNGHINTRVHKKENDIWHPGKERSRRTVRNCSEICV